MPLDLVEFVTLNTYGRRCTLVPDWYDGVSAITWAPARDVPKGEELDYSAYRAALANGAVQV